jgi:hypothetical protein
MATPVIPRVRVASAAHARAIKHGNAAAAFEAKRLMAAGRIRDYSLKVLADSPPLTDTEIAEITKVLKGEVQS